VHLDVHLLFIQRLVLICRALRAEVNRVLVFTLHYPLCKPTFSGIVVGFKLVLL
jgi:hypothetical protein